MTLTLREEPCCQTRGTSQTLSKDPELPLHQHPAWPTGWPWMPPSGLRVALARPTAPYLRTKPPCAVGRAGWMWFWDRWSLSPFREDKKAKGETSEWGFVLNQRRLRLPLVSGWRPRDMGSGTCDLLFARSPYSAGGCAWRTGCHSNDSVPQQGPPTDCRACRTSRGCSPCKGGGQRPQAPVNRNAALQTQAASSQLWPRSGWVPPRPSGRFGL